MNRKAIKNYQRFHGKNPDRESRVDFTMPKALTYLGEAHAIEYRNSRKAKQAGGRGIEPLRHKCGTGVKIYLHPNRKWILIGGGKFRVTDWMRG